MPDQETPTTPAAGEEAPTGNAPDKTGSGAQTPPTQPSPATPQGQTAPADDSQYPWLPERLERAGRKAVEDLLTNLGLKNADDAKAAFERLTKIEQAQMSEAEKQQKALEKAQKEAQEARAALETERQTRRVERLQSILRAAASGAHAPDDVVSYIMPGGAVSEEVGKLIKDDGSTNEALLKTLMERVRKERPHYFRGTGPGVLSNSDGHSPEPDQQQKAQASAELAQNVRRAW